MSTCVRLRCSAVIPQHRINLQVGRGHPQYISTIIKRYARAVPEQVEVVVDTEPRTLATLIIEQ
jgi:hypothetical protein